MRTIFEGNNYYALFFNARVRMHVLFVNRFWGTSRAIISCNRGKEVEIAVSELLVYLSSLQARHGHVSKAQKCDLGHSKHAILVLHIWREERFFTRVCCCCCCCFVEEAGDPFFIYRTIDLFSCLFVSSFDHREVLQLAGRRKRFCVPPQLCFNKYIFLTFH